MLVVIQMTVQQAVPMVNLTVVPIVVHMVSASMAHGHVMVQQTAMMAQMKPTVVVVLHQKQERDLYLLSKKLRLFLQQLLNPS